MTIQVLLQRPSGRAFHKKDEKSAYQDEYNPRTAEQDPAKTAAGPTEQGNRGKKKKW
jgi:hypothetical protein